MQASYAVKKEGKACNLIELIKNDDAFARVRENIDEMINPMFFIGRSASQVEEFIENEVKPILEKNKNELGETANIEV